LLETNYFVRFYRITRILLHTITGLAIAFFIWPFISQRKKLKLTKWWCGGLLSSFNIKLVTHGELPPKYTTSTMFVANHISWADIHAINSVIPLRFIAKSEINNWPVFGYLVRKSGTLFINRNQRKDALRIIEMTTQSLQSNDNIGFFPEGTTTDGTVILRFKSSILQAAIDASATLWPIAIRYPLSDGGINTKMAYAGDTSLMESMLNILKQKTPTVELYFLTPIQAHQSDRQAITRTALEAISMRLNF
jgi:1-acyl-sn-glycerol-3-phosphate acyltransferase